MNDNERTEAVRKIGAMWSDAALEFQNVIFDFDAIAEHLDGVDEDAAEHVRTLVSRLRAAAYARGPNDERPAVEECGARIWALEESPVVECDNCGTRAPCERCHGPVCSECGEPEGENVRVVGES